MYVIGATSWNSVGYEDVMPRLERTAIGVSVISRGLDDHAGVGNCPPPMPAMGMLLIALARHTACCRGERDRLTVIGDERRS